MLIDQVSPTDAKKTGKLHILATIASPFSFYRAFSSRAKEEDIPASNHRVLFFACMLRINGGYQKDKAQLDNI